MKCNRFIPGTRTIVPSVWEVRLQMEDWDRVKKAAESYGTTYSWVVRWCVFSALTARNMESFATAVTEFRNSGKVGASDPGSHHRMQLCLYGADETMLRCAALRLSTTITALIRVAVRLYLPIFIENRISSFEFIENGLNITARCNKKLQYSFQVIAGLAIDFIHLGFTGFLQVQKIISSKLGRLNETEKWQF